MKKYRIKTVPTKRGAFIRRRIDKNRRRAETIGLIYLFSIFALALLSFGSMLTSDYAAVGLSNSLAAFKTFEPTLNGCIKLLTAGIYFLTLAIVCINALRALTHLKNLFKKKVSRVYGLNANIDAMESLGNIFSASFIATVINYLFIYALCGSEAMLTGTAYIVAALGIAVHVICGFSGGKVSVFYIDDDKGVEECRRPYGRFIPLLRNFLQIAATAVICYYFVKYNTVHSVLLAFFMNGHGFILANAAGLIPIALQVLSIVWIMGLIAHAFGSAEYSVEGPLAPGIRSYRTFSILLTLTALATVACRYVLGETLFTLAEGASEFTAASEKWLDIPSLTIAAIAFVMFLVDCIVKLRWKDDGTEIEEEGETAPARMPLPPVPNVNITMPPQAVSVQMPAVKMPPVNVHVPQQQTPIQVNVPQQKLPQMPPIQVNVPQQQTPIQVNVPQQQLPQMPPINVHVPAQKTLPQTMPPINIHVPQQKMVMPPVNVQVPAQQATPIQVNVPQQQPVVMPPINVHVPQQQAAPTPIQVNVPAQKQQPVVMPPINVHVPQQQAAATPIQVNVPAQKQQPVVMPPINVHVPQQSATPIQVNVPAQKQQPMAMPPINVHVPQQQVAPTPIQVNVPAQQVAPTPIQVNVPKQDPVVMPPINVQMPAQQATPIQVNVPKQDPTPIQVNVPAQQPVVAPPAPINVHMPAQAAPINVNMPSADGRAMTVDVARQAAAGTPVNVNVPAAITPVNVNVPKQDPTPVNVHIPEQKPIVPRFSVLHLENESAAPAPQPQPQPAPQPAPQLPPINMQVVTPASQQVKQQPVNVSVTTPAGEKREKAEVQPIQVNVPQQAPAQLPPINIMLQMPPQAAPAPAPAPVAEAPKVEKKEDAAKETTNVVAPIVPVIPPVQEPEEEEEIVVEPRDWEICCPNCSKRLKVSDKSAYHRCPSCTKVFELHKKTKNIPD